MKPLTDYEIEQVIRTVVFRLNQMHKENIIDFPDGICIVGESDESFLYKNYEIQSQEISRDMIVATLKFVGLTELIILKIDMDILKKGKERAYNNSVNKIIDFFNDFIKSQKQVESESI